MYNYRALKNNFDSSVQLAPNNSYGLKLANPIMAASGTFGYGHEMSSLCDIQSLGAIICKATTLMPRRGNPQPRVAETPKGMLNAIGLQNPGIDAVLKDMAPLWSKWQVPVIVNIAGENIDEYAELARKTDGVPGISGLEVNISCPNVSSGCIEFGASPATAASVTKAVRQVTNLPVIVKLTPNTSDIVEIAKAVVEAGADSVSLINTLRGMAIDIKRRRPVLANVSGGLSGPAIKPVALYMVYQVASAVKVPIIGGGGVMTTDDALEFIMAGATAVEIGTANFINPSAMSDIIKGLETYAQENGIANYSEIVGSAHR
ncbi:MAG: dihydroorotate dehydrogenase [Dehalococcoidia bacterium]|nr:dihydroorotate dehydrogenase [Dehalococcoidia bacterium]